MFNLGNAKKNLLSQKDEENKYFVEEYNIDLENENDSHSIIINSLIKPQYVLDVGCGVGYIGRKIKELYNNCIVDGIEIDKEAIKIVREYYNSVYDFSIEDTDNNNYKKFFGSKIKYDYIIFADLLEHLVQPGEIIMELSKKLKPNGKIIVSVPNISHIDIISGLIDDTFNYNKTGIIDTTHLRFFTENSFYNFIDNLNDKYNTKFQCKIINKTYAKGEDKDDSLLFSVKGMDCYVFQNIFEVTISDVKNSHKIKKENNYKKINDIFLLKNQIEKDLIQEKQNFEMLQETLTKKEEKNCLLKEEIDKINNKNKELEKVVNLLNEQLEISQDILKNIYESKSWKLTKPLRGIKSLFSKKR